MAKFGSVPVQRAPGSRGTGHRGYARSCAKGQRKRARPRRPYRGRSRYAPAPEGGRGYSLLLDRAFLDLGYLVGEQAVCLAVDGLGRLLVRGLCQAEDLARLFVEPVPEVLDPVLVQDLLVLPVGVGDRLGGEPFDVLVVVHEHRHRANPPFRAASPKKGGPIALKRDHDAPRAGVAHPPFGVSLGSSRRTSENALYANFLERR